MKVKNLYMVNDLYVYKNSDENNCYKNSEAYINGIFIMNNNFLYNLLIKLFIIQMIKYRLNTKCVGDLLWKCLNTI